MTDEIVKSDIVGVDHFCKVFMTVPETPEIWIGLTQYHENLRIENVGGLKYADMREISTFFGQYPDMFEADAIYLDLSGGQFVEEFSAIQFLGGSARKNITIKRSDLSKYPAKFTAIKKTYK